MTARPVPTAPAAPVARRLTRVPGLLHGGDYNPEQWPEPVWAEDAALMRQAGVNLVTVGVFAWAELQPGPETWEFGWLDRLLDLLHAHGVAVDLATATASPPAWLVRAHPELLPVTADGVRLEFGSRQHYCPSSPVYRAAAVRLTRALAQRYADHPALALWHVHNEYGDHVTECFCAGSAADFRRWLTERYGSVERLNQAWGTAFWSQRYRELDEVEPPRRAPGPINPTQQLDWRRFCSDALLACHRAERAVLAELSPGVPVTTNFMSMSKPLDLWRWAEHEDLVSDDAYPDPADPRAPVRAALNYDLMRSLKGGAPWLLLEQAPSAVSWRPVNVPKTPAQRRLWALQAVAHGSDGVLSFQWRASRAGAEKFHSAMLPHRGTDSRGWRETVRFGAELARLGSVAGGRTRAETAIVLDWESWWALELDEHPSARMRWPELLLPWYAALHRRGVAVDFVRPEAELGGYRAVLAPNLYLLRTADAHRLAAFAAGGGQLACGAFSGVVDEHDQVHPGGAPGPLRELLGLAVDEFWPLADGTGVPVLLDGTDAPALPAGPDAPQDAAPPLTATLWSEWLECAGAVPLARYGAGPLAGRPAVTRHGNAWYLGCHLGPDTGAVLDRVLAAAGVTPALPVPEGVEATVRTSPDGADHLFLLNHGHRAAEVALPARWRGARDLLGGPAGDRPVGDQPTGDHLAGDQPTGDQLAGDQPTGDQLAGDRLTLEPLGAAVLLHPQGTT
ncbi:beta-galactosidase [Kitasatospora sp. NBC_01287]|uniref:beta-galactosidase n=1 Tax=Kitasatospora sp. NBC_01287 TaxID=2903573 RepID=UPI002253E8FC|nr:beta-galactosidase [Kitasatospora sp. NBC_01287]MCX4745747.1 beta-galactosidase [Kitasatospora sp. NBC_01287]